MKLDTEDVYFYDFSEFNFNFLENFWNTEYGFKRGFCVVVCSIGVLIVSSENIPISPISRGGKSPIPNPNTSY